MYCKDCVYFRSWKAFGAAMCEAGSKAVEPYDETCELFVPKGRYSEWGEELGCGFCRV